MRGRGCCDNALNLTGKIWYSRQIQWSLLRCESLWMIKRLVFLFFPSVHLWWKFENLADRWNAVIGEPKVFRRAAAADARTGFVWNIQFFTPTTTWWRINCDYERLTQWTKLQRYDRMHMKCRGINYRYVIDKPVKPYIVWRYLRTSGHQSTRDAEWPSKPMLHVINYHNTICFNLYVCSCTFCIRKAAKVNWSIVRSA